MISPITHASHHSLRRTLRCRRPRGCAIGAAADGVYGASAHLSSATLFAREASARAQGAAERLPAGTAHATTPAAADALCHRAVDRIMRRARGVLAARPRRGGRRQASAECARAVEVGADSGSALSRALCMRVRRVRGVVARRAAARRRRRCQDAARHTVTRSARDERSASPRRDARAGRLDAGGRRCARRHGRHDRRRRLFVGRARGGRERRDEWRGGALSRGE